MINSPSNTTQASWAVVIKQALETYPVDVTQAFAVAGIDMAVLNDPLNRVPAEGIKKLWLAATEISGDEYFGLNAGRFVTPSTFFAIGLSALTSENILDAYRIAVYGADLISSGLNLSLSQVQDYWVFELSMKPGFPEFAPQGVDAGLAGLLHIIRHYFGLNLTLEKLSLRRDSPSDPSVFESCFGCPIEFNSQRNAAYLSNFEQLIQRFPMANVALRQINQALVEEQVRKLADESLSGRVSKEIKTRLEQGLPTDQQAISRALYMGERKLQLGLKREGASFQSILDHNRYHMALQLLTREKLPVTRIALQLGFREVSSFTRAFKRWTGSTPREFSSSS